MQASGIISDIFYKVRRGFPNSRILQIVQFLFQQGTSKWQKLQET